MLPPCEPLAPLPCPGFVTLMTNHLPILPELTDTSVCPPRAGDVPRPADRDPWCLGRLLSYPEQMGIQDNRRAWPISMNHTPSVSYRQLTGGHAMLCNNYTSLNTRISSAEQDPHYTLGSAPQTGVSTTHQGQHPHAVSEPCPDKTVARVLSQPWVSHTQHSSLTPHFVSPLLSFLYSLPSSAF